MKRFWVAVRFLIFVPVAALLVSGYALAGLMNMIVFAKEGRSTIRRFWMSWWHWVTGEISTYDLIK
jgi:hypothetical protein